MSENQQENKVQQVKEQLANVQHKMKENLQITIARGHKLEELQDKSEKLIKDSEHFYARSVQVKRKQQRKHCMCVIAILIVLCFLVVLLYLILK